MRTLERNSKTLKGEKNVLQDEISSLKEQLSQRDKDLRAMKGTHRETQDEVSRLTDKLADVRSQKVKFSRLAREKGEEIGVLK